MGIIEAIIVAVVFIALALIAVLSPSSEQCEINKGNARAKELLIRARSHDYRV